MKTEMKTAYIHLSAYSLSCGLHNPTIEVSFNKPESRNDFIKKELSTIEIAVPVLTLDEMGELLNGAEIEVLQARKKTLQAETDRQLMMIDERIGKLTALENKESK